MWLFYLISLPLTLGMVCVTLRYFAGPDIPRYVIFTVGYAWFCSLSIIILVPADIWTTILGHDKGGMAFFWGWSYWSTFALTWAVVPTIQGYEDAGDFTAKERLKSSIQANLVFYLSVGSIGLFGVILLIAMHKMSQGIVGLAMGCSNTFGLVTGAFLLGFGLSEIPKSIWRNADWATRRKVLSHRVAKMAVNLDNAHRELSNAIVVIEKDNPEQPLWNYVKKIGKGPGGGGNVMFACNFCEKRFTGFYTRCKAHLLHIGGIGIRPCQKLTNEDIKILKKEQDAAEKKSSSKLKKADVAQATSKQMSKRDPLRPYMDVIDDMLHQMFKKDPGFKPTGGRLGENDMDYDADEKSMATLRRQLRIAQEEYYRYRSEYMKYVTEALELEDAVKNYEHGSETRWKYVSSLRPARTGTPAPFLDTLEWFWRCILRKHLEKLVAVLLGCLSAAILLAEATLLPAVDLSLFSILIRTVGKQEMLVQRMGNIDDAVPFFGRGFNRIYPLIMVVYTLLVASNFFHKVVNFFGNWKRLSFQNEAEDMDGFDPSGVIILQKERSWLQQGSNIGESIVPLVRNFNAVSADIESGTVPVGSARNEIKSLAASLSRDDGGGSQSRTFEDENGRYNSRREDIERKYAALKGQQRRDSKPSFSVSLLESGNSRDEHNSIETTSSSSGLSNTWASMKTNFQNFRANLDAKGFLQLRQTRESKPNSDVPEKSLDEIFKKIKKPPENRGDEF
ncbi:domain-containing 2-like protein A [Nymphaea thermarum]|nr:domain-containing 2-like protein A [Nymphaea thermarum]